MHGLVAGAESSINAVEFPLPATWVGRCSNLCDIESGMQLQWEVSFLFQSLVLNDADIFRDLDNF